MPERNGMTTSLDGSTSVLPVHVLLLACPQYAAAKFYAACTWARLTDLDPAAPGHPTAPLCSPKFDICVSAIRKVACNVSCSCIIKHTF